MGKKKKRNKAKAATDFEEAMDEMLALQSIYEQEFTPAEHGNGFNILIVPHPGDSDLNKCSIEMEIRCATQT